MFDSMTHTQGGVPHLLEYLRGKYLEHLQAEIERRLEQKRPCPYEDAEAAAATLSFGVFYRWACAFLKEHRPVERFYVDDNEGFRLANNDLVALCPGVEGIEGTMQEAGAVAVMHGRSQPGNEGVVQINTLPIR